MLLAAWRRRGWFGNRGEPRPRRLWAKPQVQQLEDRLVPAILFCDPSGIGPNGKPAYTSIQAAVNAATNGSTIVVDPGTYSEDVSIAKGNITLVGAQAGVNPVPGRTGAESVLNGSITITGAGDSVDGFTINSTEQWALEVGLPAPNTPAKNALITNNIVTGSIYGIQIGAEGGPTTTPVPLYAVVKDNVVDTTNADIVLFNTGNNQVLGNLVSSSSYAGIDNYYANNDAILGNIVNNCALCAIRLRGSHRVLVENNSGSGNGSPAVSVGEGSSNNTILNNSFPPDVVGTTAGHSTLYVDPSGTGPGGLPAYTTIQAAVDAAKAGAIIVVDPGNYSENVTISKRVLLYGAQAGINPVPGRSGSESVLDGSITITAAGVTVDGFTINSTGQWAIEIGGTSAPSVAAQHAVIADNIIGSASVYGIQVGAEGSPTTQNVNLYALVQDNVLTTSNADIPVFNTGRNTIQGNLINSNPNQFGSGIDVYYSNTDFILGNGIYDAPAPTSPWYFAAIKFRGDHGNLVMNNGGTGDGQPAIYQTEGASGNTLLSNDFPA